MYIVNNMCSVNILFYYLLLFYLFFFLDFYLFFVFIFFFQAEDGIRDGTVTGVQTCALPILRSAFSLRLRCLRTPAASSMNPRRSSGRACSTASSWPCPTTTCSSRPMPESLISSWMSTRRHFVPLMAYSDAPSRNISRLTLTSAYSIGSAPSVLSMVRVTSARPSGALPGVPAKMTSSILPPRRALAPCSPRTQAIASTTLDLPDPLGPTTQVMPGSKRSVVGDAKDLKPFSVRLLRCTVAFGVSRGEGRWGHYRPAAGKTRKHDEGASLSERPSATPIRLDGGLAERQR